MKQELSIQLQKNRNNILKVKKKLEKQQCSKLFKTVVRNKKIRFGFVRHQPEDQKFGLPTQKHQVTEEKTKQTKTTLNR